MCGINGGYNIAETTINPMVEATSHRGPDATGLLSLGSVTLGHNRLSIIDTSERSNQPIKSPDGQHLLVFNGEIYNFKSLRQSLPDWKFVSDGDSEVLLAALATWGLSALDRIEGIFAFGWYQLETDTLTLVRDHMGVKPLYYAEQNDTLLFSSELSGILAGTGLRTLHKEAAGHFLMGNYVPSPYTLIEGVQKLRPGHLVQFRQGELTTKRYFFPNKPQVHHLDKDTIRDVIGTEVVSQLVSDRPLGLFLSGGLDSSIVLHHAATAGKMRTFSTSFEMIAGGEHDTQKFNTDAVLAAKTANHYGCEHTEFQLSLDQIRSTMIPIIEQSDEPVANATIVPQFLLSQLVREAGIVVALGGDGGDELWGGYSRHSAVLSAQYFQMFPRAVQALLEPLHKNLRRLRTPLGAPMHSSLTIFPSTILDRILRQSDILTLSQSILSDRYQEETLSGLSPIEAFMRADRELWLSDDSLHRSDRTSMASGVELRVPLLGLPVVNLADSLKAEHKFTPFTTKKILKEAYQGHLPEYLFKEPKRGWLAPGAKWLRDPVINQQVRGVFSDSYYDGLSGLIDWHAVQVVLDEHVAGTTYALNPLWNLFALQIWARKYRITSGN